MKAPRAVSGSAGDWMAAVWIESRRREWGSLLSAYQWISTMQRLRECGWVLRWGANHE